MEGAMDLLGSHCLVRYSCSRCGKFGEFVVPMTHPIGRCCTGTHDDPHGRSAMTAGIRRLYIADKPDPLAQETQAYVDGDLSLEEFNEALDREAVNDVR
jgi:hypothetical protein